MKVHIVLVYQGSKCTVEKVYSNRASAEMKVFKLKEKMPSLKGLSFHVITKSINGLLDFGLSSTHRNKVYRMTEEHLNAQIKKANQAIYIQKLEKKIKEQKELIKSLGSVVDKQEAEIVAYGISHRNLKDEILHLEDEKTITVSYLSNPKINDEDPEC